MKILMDADCLIKVTKAGFKDHVCRHDEIVIPTTVKKEVVDVGKAKGCLDADLVEKNIQNDLIRVSGEESLGYVKGDQALIEIFKQTQYDAIATDDAKLVRLLKSASIPFILPGIIIYSLYQRNIIDRPTALNWIDKLSDFISDDEYSMVKILVERNYES